MWLVPFSLFVSLSAGENVLPSMGSEYATGDSSSGSSTGGSLSRAVDTRGKKGAKGLVRVAVDSIRQWVSETGEVWRGEKTRSF